MAEQLMWYQAKSERWHLVDDTTGHVVCGAAVGSMISGPTHTFPRSKQMCTACGSIALNLIQSNDEGMDVLIGKSIPPESTVAMNGEQCGTCYFSRYGHCHRNPPVVDITRPTRMDYMKSQSGVVPDRHRGVWPEVSESRWCGEWKTKETT